MFAKPSKISLTHVMILEGPCSFQMRFVQTFFSGATLLTSLSTLVLTRPWPSCVDSSGGYPWRGRVCLCLLGLCQEQGLLKTPSGLLNPVPIPSRPWSHIGLDFVTGLPVSKGNSVILTV